MLAQRLQRWTNIVQILYKCFVFAGMWQSGYQGPYILGTPIVYHIRRYSNSLRWSPSEDSVVCSLNNINSKLLLGQSVIPRPIWGQELEEFFRWRSHIPANTTRWNDDVLMLGQRRRRWANNKTSLFQRVVFTGISPAATQNQKAVSTLILAN